MKCCNQKRPQKKPLKEHWRGSKKLAYILKNFMKSQNMKGREARKIAAIRMAQSGWSNQEIAVELDCHPNTIGRDLKKAVSEWA